MNEPLRARRLLGPYALLYLYRRRLRVHAVQELLAGAGVAVAVALVSATLIVSGAVAGSTAEVVRAVVGPASLQLRARGAQGLPEGLLARVEALPAVAQAAPAARTDRDARRAHGPARGVDLAGSGRGLVTLDGLAHTLPLATLSAGGDEPEQGDRQALGLPPQPPSAKTSRRVRLLGGRAFGSRLGGARPRSLRGARAREHRGDAAGAAADLAGLKAGSRASSCRPGRASSRRRAGRWRRWRRGRGGGAADQDVARCARRCDRAIRRAGCSRRSARCWVCCSRSRRCC